MSENQNPLERKESQGVTQGTNAMGNLFSLNDLLSTTHTIEDLEKIHENQKKLKNDFVSNKEEMRKKLKLLDCENALFIGDATFRKENDMNNFGLIILTEFRFIFEFLEKNSDKEKFKEDFFKIPYLLFSKISKGDQKSAYLPFTISVRDGRKLLFYLNEKDKTVLNELQARAFPKTFDLFAFPKLLNDNLSNNPKYQAVNGWNVYDFNKEFLRQGVIFDDQNCKFKLCEINKDFKNIPTYPLLLVEPKSLSDEVILKASKHRTKGRVPTLSFYFDNKTYGKDSSYVSGIWRSSQFKSGILGSKSNDDIELIKAIKSLGNNLVIFDARPYLNASANKVKGGGYEDVEQYGNDAQLIFCDIENIHKAREALEKTEEICTDKFVMTNKSFWSQFEATGWLDFIMITLKKTTEIAKLVSEGNNVLIHCSDGWDRTPQLVAVSQVLLDPYFRTFMGFAVLIEKEFLSFGHQFAKRSGMLPKKNEGEKEISPIFLQFIDCIYQLLIQFPTEFEFNVDYLLFIAKNYSVNLFGTFMFNNEEERVKNKAKETTPSVWTYLLNNKEIYTNPLYSPNKTKKIITPNYAYYSYKLWTTYFMRNSEYAE
jgi:hypothetical protein